MMEGLTDPPIPLWEAIFTMLDLQTVQGCGSVCKKWSSIITAKFLATHFYRDMYADEIPNGVVDIKQFILRTHAIHQRILTDPKVIANGGLGEDDASRSFFKKVKFVITPADIVETKDLRRFYLLMRWLLNGGIWTIMRLI